MSQLNERLTNGESQGLIRAFSICTVTFMRGNIEMANHQLRDRLTLVLTENPWLCGNLKRKKDKNLLLNYPSQIKDSHVTAIFNPKLRGRRETRLPVVNSTMDFSQICNEISGSACEILLGKDCIDNEEPLVALSVLPDSIRKDTFAVVFSVSHTIIDGCTYYSLLSMISADGKPSAMKFARKADADEKIGASLGIMELQWSVQPSTFFNIVLTALFSLKKAIAYNSYLDSNRLQITKENAKKEPSSQGFVSTNDVLASTFSKAAGLNVLMMAINFRVRIPDFCNDDAGNYEGFLIFGRLFPCCLQFYVNMDGFTYAIFYFNVTVLKNSL
jgi:hypothetical protein